MGVGRFTSGQGPRSPHPFKKLRGRQSRDLRFVEEIIVLPLLAIGPRFMGYPAVTILTELTRLYARFRLPPPSIVSSY